MRPRPAFRAPFALAAVLAGAPAHAQTTWYVDVHGTPPGTGTAADPYTSIQFAHNQPTTLNGDTLLVAPGVYEQDLTAAKSVHILAGGGPAVTQLRPTQEVGLFGAVVLEGFSIVRSTPSAPSTGTVAIGGATLRNCVVSRENPSAVGVWVSTHGWIESCVITRHAIGVNLGGFDFFVHIEDSIVHGNTTWDLELFGFGTSTVSYSAGMTKLHPGTLFTGVGNVFADPKLWNIQGGDYQLAPGSPCIDAGDPGAPPDPDGSPADIGFLAFDAGYVPPTTSYCTGKLNSQGCVPQIGWIGSASATSPLPFQLTAADVVPDMPGLLFYGFGPRAAPFQGGIHCVEPPTPRVGGQFSSPGGTACSGTYGFDMRAHIQGGQDPKLVPGAIVYCQWWARDLQDPTGFGISLTNAAWFWIAP